MKRDYDLEDLFENVPDEFITSVDELKRSGLLHVESLDDGEYDNLPADEELNFER